MEGDKTEELDERAEPDREVKRGSVGNKKEVMTDEAQEECEERTAR
jgi:hypothetical protein